VGERARTARPEASLTLVPVLATPASAAPFGVLLGAEVPNPGLPIPYYRSSVIEGEPLPFACDGPVLVRAARLLPRSGDVVWLERHLHVTQTFVALGGAPFVLVVAPPADAPELAAVRALYFPPGHGLLLHRGTWHEFPLALTEPATVLTINSREIVETLASVVDARELASGDVEKVHVADRLGATIVVDLAVAPRP
jgi:ureidoglycolate lyase